jgi:hypothetical protein
MVGSFQPLARSAIAAAFLLAASGASAQLAVYKAADPLGQTSHSDTSDASTKPLEASADSESPAPQVKRRALPSRNSAMVNANEARRRLAQAELKRSRGKSPLPGETTRGPDGVAVNDRYWQRQVKLRIEADEAQRRVNATQKTALARQ